MTTAPFDAMVQNLRDLAHSVTEYPAEWPEPRLDGQGQRRHRTADPSDGCDAMTTELRPTAARVALLQAVNDGLVDGSRDGTLKYTARWHRQPGDFGDDVTRRVYELQDAGWVKSNTPPFFDASKRPVEVTAEGRTVLANTKEKP
jgi:hypothetical protein